MTGIDISNELKELNDDMSIIYKVMETITSDLATNEITKVLAVMGDEYNKKANTEYVDKSKNNITIKLNAHGKEMMKELRNFDWNTNPYNRKNGPF